MDDILAHVMCFSDLQTRGIMSRVCKSFRDIHRLAPVRADFDRLPDHVAGRATRATVTPENYERFAATNFIYLHSIQCVNLCAQQVYFALGILPKSCTEVYVTDCEGALDLRHLELDCFEVMDSNVTGLPNCSKLIVDATSIARWDVPRRLRHLVLLQEKEGHFVASRREFQLFEWLGCAAAQLESLTIQQMLTDPLVKSLRMFPKLEFLVLRGNTRYLWATAPLLRSMFPMLRSLTIDDCNVISEEIGFLNLPRWCQLTSLSITGNDTLKSLGPLPESLVFVNLCGNGMTATACIQACEPLRNLKTAVLPLCRRDIRDRLSHVHSVLWKNVRPPIENLTFTKMKS